MIKRYLFNAMQAAYLRDIKGIIVSTLPREGEKRLKSVFFKNTLYSYDICVQVDEKKLPLNCTVSLIHEALESLERNPATDLVKALRRYLQLSQKKIKQPINANFCKAVSQFIGRVIGAIVSTYSLVVLASIIPVGTAFPLLSVIIVAMAVLCIASITLCHCMGYFIGNQIARSLNNRFQSFQSKREEELKELISQNNQKKENPTSNTLSFNFFSPNEGLWQRMERIPTYVTPSYVIPNYK